MRTAPLPRHSPWLDATRGLAAFAVCVAHVRAFFLVDYPQSGGGVAAKLFYALTGLHHQAVMVFFVLSGFFVGGGLLRQLERGSVDWSRYALKRLTRLWCVLAPALVLTLLWDRAGMQFGSPEAYSGAWFGQLSSGPTPSVPADHSAVSLIGNLFFLQTVIFPVFGSNGPLWSLANEGWYYALFPFALLLLKRRTALWGGALLIGSIWLLEAFNPAILLLGLNWLFGVGAYVAVTDRKLRNLLSSMPWRALSCLLFAGTLGASRAGLAIGNDLFVGLAFALMVPWLASIAMPSAAGRKVSGFAADFSYTLYLTHFPLLAGVYALTAGPRQLPFAPLSLLAIAGLFIAALAYAIAVWWLFERNTDRLRAALEKALPKFAGTYGRFMRLGRKHT